MMKNIKYIIILIVLILLLITISFIGFENSANIFVTTKPILNSSSSEFITTNENIIEENNYKLHQTDKILPNGDIYFAQKFEFIEDNKKALHVQFDILGTEGTVTYYDPINKLWLNIDILDDMPMETLYIKTDQTQLIISPPYNYTPIEVASMEANNENCNPVSFTKSKEKGFICNIDFKQVGGTEGHFWALESNEKLIDIDDTQQQIIWAGYNDNINQRWAYDGYYYKTPSSYKPTSDKMFWRNPSSYLPSKLTQARGSRASESLSYVMLDTVIKNAEGEGYWLTYPKSETFLYNDYGMQGGFYDTRFNTDITETLFTAYYYTKDEAFLNSAINQLNFFVDFAYSHNYDVSIDGKKGILVEDYYHPNGNYSKTHTSLNHHLAEINTLYLGYELTKDQRYLELIEVMLQGVTNTLEKWIKDDNSLEYAYMPDGTMGLVDYPYLTYNDLFEVQETRIRLGFERDKSVDTLMYHKKLHMDANNITGYKK